MIRQEDRPIAGDVVQIDPAHDERFGKAAAERLRSQVSEYRDNYYLNDDQNADNRSRHESLMRSFVLAAQALEALAWQEKNKAGVGPGWTGTGWLCEVRDQEYVADTPLGALLAAMEGEKCK